MDGSIYFPIFLSINLSIYLSTYLSIIVYLQVLLVVNHMIFLKDLAFSSSQSGPQGRELRTTATGPAAASRAKGSGLSFLSEDMHNVILDAVGLNASG
jgi:hypothetical protein|tara:strand:+ start:279 stop:572 length:294 start_codon:yes stop_codon:yes gene_type:complete